MTSRDEHYMEIARRWFTEGWTGKLALADEIFSAEVRTNGVHVGVAGPVGRIRDRLAGFPDLSTSIEDMFASGDKLAVTLTWQGTHNGTYGGVAATGKPVAVRDTAIWHFRDGLVVEILTLQDQFGFLKQIGYLPDDVDAALSPLQLSQWRLVMDLHLKGQTAIVTGAGRGIGLAITRGLVAEGAVVIAGAHKSTPELDELARSGAVQVVEGDLAEPDGPARLVAAAGDRADILVNNVGAAPARPGGFGEITDEDWQASLTLNLMAAVRATRAVLPVMRAAGKGAIVNISSVNAVLPDPSVMDYSAAKGALANFSKSLSKEVGPHGIRVNTISPGPVATDLWLGDHGVAATVSRATGASPQEVESQAARQMVTGRFTRPEEVADLVLILASDRTANVTGADITIDGGLIPTW